MNRSTLPPRASEALAWSAVASVCLAPFLFGAVDRRVWMPLCLVWLTMGLLSAAVALHASPGPGGRQSAADSLSRAMLPLHALFALQLIPLPGEVLRVLSPGSHAAHFLPDPGDGRYRPLSVSPGATIEAWFYVAALQGLFLAAQGLPQTRRRSALRAVIASVMILAAEGLWQSRLEQRYLLYGRFPTDSPQGLDTSAYGPYYNRNHFAGATALGVALCAGLIAAASRDAGSFRRLIQLREGATTVVVLAGCTAWLGLATAASGSRSGTLAALAAVASVTFATAGLRAMSAAVGLGAILALTAGPSSLDRLARLDFVASRLAPWADMTTLFRFFPAFGAGIGAFGAAYWPYQRNAAYEFWQHAHNEYLEWGIESGLVGVLIALLVLRRTWAMLSANASMVPALTGILTVVTVQSLLDFPMRIPANAGLAIVVLSLCTHARADRR